MEELVDYSGKFDPEFSHDKFTKETLLKLLKAYSESMLRMDGFWFLTVMDKWGNDEAIDCDLRVWEKSQAYEMRTLGNLLNIHGDDVATLMKLLQVNPWTWIQDRVTDIKNNNYAILTVRTCPTLFSLEKEGKGRERQHCHLACQRIISLNASHFNPNIKVTPLKLPPRENNNDICCQWEFKLER
jgi:Family of unknown function (DUF6125)